MKHHRSRKKEIILLIIAVCCALFIAELITRVFVGPFTISHPHYGWARSDPAIEVVLVHDDVNNTRNVTIVYGPHGFKRWGDLNTTKKRVLIIGDSFAEMRFVNNGEEWYAYLERAFPNATFFVYGTGGFGSLQEEMILEDFIGEIKPDVIIWQFYFNDFINNVYFADRSEYPLNNLGIRPYLEKTGVEKGVEKRKWEQRDLEKWEINYRMPAPFFWLRQHSRIAQIALNSYDQKTTDYWNSHKADFYSRVYGVQFWNKDFSQANVFHGRFNESLDATKEIFLRARKTAPNATIYLFSGDDRLGWAEEDVCAAANITYIPGIWDLARHEELAGRNPYVIDDRHWNVYGNRVVGDYLVEYLKNQSTFS
jgi:hypothetical protein